jgi:hypothetical protein
VKPSTAGCNYRRTGCIAKLASYLMLRVCARDTNLFCLRVNYLDIFLWNLFFFSDAHIH